MNEELINKLEKKLEKEIDFYTDDSINLDDKKEKLNVSLAINKLTNTIIQAEALKQRSRENEIKTKENNRLVKRFDK